MALYTFICEKCGEIELNISMKDIPLKECPKCGSKNIQRKFRPTVSIWKCDGACGKG
ncbi:MAG: FmdB family zinc ribbon protein [Deltaproteobacteria bacterium]